MTSNPISQMTDAVPGLGPAMNVMNLLKSVNGLAGPQGSLTQGDLAGIASGVSGISGAANGLANNYDRYMNGPSVQNTLNMSKAQFDTLPPEVKQELLRRAMGR